MKTNRGFSLLELLIVVAIILIITTIAIPSFLRSRQNANESSAVSNVRTLNTAQVTYAGSNRRYGAISDLITAGLTDSRFTGTVSGYNYTIDIDANGVVYTMYAVGATVNSGRYDYYSTPDFVIRYSTDSTRAPIGLAGLPTR